MKINKLLQFFIILMFSIFIANSVTQPQVLVHYAFEEGSGNIVLDTSGNGNHGIVNGATWSALEKVFGDYAMIFDGTDDYVKTITSRDTPEDISIAFWVDIDTNTGNSTLMEISDSEKTEELSLFYDNDNGHLYFRYISELGGYVNYQLPNSQITVGTDTNLAISYDYSSGMLSFWKSGALNLNTTIYPKINKSTNLKSLIIGTNSTYGNDYDGTIDEFYITDFVFNQTIVNKLVNENKLIVPTAIEPPINIISQYNIINYTNPVNASNNTNIVNFNAKLNTDATCELYIDNNLEKTFYDISAFSYNKTYAVSGTYEYFVYCSFIQNSTKYYEYSNVTYFNVLPQNPYDVTFQVVGSDFDVNTADLWLTTPCLDKGYSAIGVKVGYQPKYNPNGAIFSKFENGLATITVSENINQFCIFNGRIIVDENNFTHDWQTMEAIKNIDIGNFTTNNQSMAIYTVNLDSLDIYDAYTPQAWGKTWRDIISGIVLLLIGGMITFAGIYTDNGKVVFAGAMIVLGAFGITMSGLVGILV